MIRLTLSRTVWRSSLSNMSRSWVMNARPRLIRLGNRTLMSRLVQALTARHRLPSPYRVCR